MTTIAESEIAISGDPVRNAPRPLAHVRSILMRLGRYGLRLPAHMLRSLDYQARPWKREADASRAACTPIAKFKRSVSFAMAMVVVSAAMMAALLLPDRDPAIARVIVETRSTEDAALSRTDGNRVVAPVMLISATPSEEWQPVRKPVQVFHLEGPETEGANLDYRVFARGRDARQDMMIWTPRSDRLESRGRITLTIERFEASQPTQRPLFSDIAQRASEQHGVLERMADAAEIVTKFGPMQIADAILTFDGKPSACTVFRRLDTSGLVIAGWYCFPAKRPVDRVAVACFVNRLDLVSAGTDRELRRHFAEAERNRGNCVSARQSGRRITWLDHEAPVPELKLSAMGR